MDAKIKTCLPRIGIKHELLWTWVILLFIMYCKLYVSKVMSVYCGFIIIVWVCLFILVMLLENNIQLLTNQFLFVSG